MKKSIIWLAAVLVLSGCIKDERNNFMVSDSLGVISNNGVIEASVHTGSCTVGIVKSGKGLTEARVLVNRDAEACTPLLEQYNQEHNTSYQSVLGSLVEADQSELAFSASDVSRNLTLTWDADLMARFMGEGKNYVIPVLIESATPDVKVNKGRDFLLIHLNRSSLELKQGTQVRSIERKNVEGEDAQLIEDMVLDLVIDNPLKGVDMTFPIGIDNSLIDQFNVGKQVVYQAAPDGLITLIDHSATIPGNNLSTVFHIRLDKSVLLKGGKYADFPPYVVPVRVQQEGMKAFQNQEEVEVKGLSFGNMVCYITVAPAEKGITAVSREWGLYSDNGAWYNFLSEFSASADRTVAMDDELVYVSRSSKQGGIYAISLSSGAFVKQLDVTPALATDCTLTVSCVRSIPNPGGKNVLTFCTLKEDASQHLFVYAYVNGTDAAPVQILDFSLDNKGGVDDWRRYGDRYTVEGNWKSGKLWFQTWHDGGTAKTIGFTIENGEITNPKDPIDYYIANPPAGIKDVAFYPGSSQAFITGPGKATLYKPGSAGPNGWIKWDVVEELENLKFSYGYNFFTFHDSRFIAYMQLDGENAASGRLVIIDDAAATPDQFAAQLQAQAGLREFPIQHPVDFSAKSSVTASSSVGDCTLCEVNGNTYIAVLMQGCGLSLFQLQ